MLRVEAGRAAGPAAALLLPAPAPVPAQLPAAAQPLRAKHGHMLVTGAVTRTSLLQFGHSSFWKVSQFLMDRPSFNDRVYKLL